MWRQKPNEPRLIHPTNITVPVETTAPDASHKVKQSHLDRWRELVLADMKGNPAIEKFRRLQAQLQGAEGNQASGPDQLRILEARRKSLTDNPPDDLLQQLQAVDRRIADIQSQNEADPSMATLRSVTADARAAVVTALGESSRKHGFALRETTKAGIDKRIADLLAKNSSTLDEIAGLGLLLVRLDNLAESTVSINELMALQSPAAATTAAKGAA